MPEHLQVLVVIFFVGNLIHSAYGTEYIAFYPGMPTWVAREKVYLYRAAGANAGLAGLLVYRARLKLLGLALLASGALIGRHVAVRSKAAYYCLVEPKP